MFLRVNEEAAIAKTSGSSSYAKLFKGIDIYIDPEPERVTFSSPIHKMNKHGIKQTRYIMIT